MSTPELNQSRLFGPEPEMVTQPYLLPPRSIEEEFEPELTGDALLKTIVGEDKNVMVTGLPCGELRGFIASVTQNPDVLHLPTTNEREAVGVAAGSWLGGKTPVLYMQNSGLFEASNDVGSLLIPSGIPAVFVVSWRGISGETATQHLVTGSATPSLLGAFGMSFTDRSTRRNVQKLLSEGKISHRPIAFLQKREKFNPSSENQQLNKTRLKGKVIILESSNSLPSREQVLSRLVQVTPADAALISSTGLISRSLFHHSDSENQFYNAGGFGLTSSIGLGLALSRTDKKVVVIEGDGSVLTDMGNLNLIGHYAPTNFIHVVLDNRALVSCSGEPTLGSENIPMLAHSLGYKLVVSGSNLETISEILETSIEREEGPIMIHIPINREGRRDFSRPNDMAHNALRFRAFLTRKRDYA